MGRVFKKTGGFTLIELILVVATLSLLAAIGVPAYVHQMNVARQKEAKASLSELSSAMKTFFAEYTQSTSRFDVIGFNPSGELHYDVGFSADHPVAGANVPYAGQSTCIQTDTGGGTPVCGGAGPWVFTPKWVNNPTADSAATSGPGINGYISTNGLPASFPVAGGWTAYAIAKFGGNNVDGWSIDSHDNLINCTNGI